MAAGQEGWNWEKKTLSIVSHHITMCICTWKKADILLLLIHPPCGLAWGTWDNRSGSYWTRCPSEDTLPSPTRTSHHTCPAARIPPTWNHAKLHWVFTYVQYSFHKIALAWNISGDTRTKSISFFSVSVWPTAHYNILYMIGFPTDLRATLHSDGAHTIKTLIADVATIAVQLHHATLEILTFKQIYLDIHKNTNQNILRLHYMAMLKI